MGEAERNDPSRVADKFLSPKPEEERSYAVLNTVTGVAIATRVTVAGTSAARRKGLRGVDELAAGNGLWIAPCEAIHTFGMRMPIDVVFLDREFRARKLLNRVVPWRIAICPRAYSVLELQAGAISQSGTKLGDRLDFQKLSALQAHGQSAD